MNQDKTTMVGVRAVDVGYFNVKYTRGRKRVGASNVIDVGLFPALAPQRAAAAVSVRGAAAGVCTVCVGGVPYAVGPGAVYHTSGSEPRPIDPDYCATDRYHALTLGALHHMAQAEDAQGDLHIELLVLGLPLNNYARHAAALAQRMRGEHLLGDPAGGQPCRRVTVAAVHVMVQPHGALCHFGASRCALEGWTLVVDPGGGTLDWFMAHGQQPNWKRSGAYPKAMLQCAYAVADSIEPGWRHQFEVVEAIDQALRSGSAHFQVGARTFELAPFRPKVDAVLQESVKAMLEGTGPLDAVRRILLTGGGAGVYRDFLVRTQPALAGAITLDEDPIFSNVKGFQVCGEVLHRTAEHA